MTDFQMKKANRPDALRQRKEPQAFSCQGITHEPTTAFPNDLAIGMHPSYGQCAAILGHRGVPGAGRIGAVMTDRHLLIQGFMRTLAIIIMPPAFKTPLLRPRVGCWRPQGIGFKDPMMLFVGGILLGTPFGRKFHCNAQTPPPNTQPCQRKLTRRGPEVSMITADHAWMAIAFEQSFKKYAQRCV